MVGYRVGPLKAENAPAGDCDFFWSRRLECATCGGRRKLSWPLFSPIFLRKKQTEFFAFFLNGQRSIAEPWSFRPFIRGAFWQDHHFTFPALNILIRLWKCPPVAATQTRPIVGSRGETSGQWKPHGREVITNKNLMEGKRNVRMEWVRQVGIIPTCGAGALKTGLDWD